MKTHVAILVCGTLSSFAVTGCTHKIEANGDSSSTIHVPKMHVKLKALPGGAGIKFPTKDGPIEIPPGAEIELDTDGGDIVITDKVNIGSQQAMNPGSGNMEGYGTLRPGSTYAFAAPDLFGAYQSNEVPLMGAFSFVAAPSAALPGPGGSMIINPLGILSLSYNASGPAPVWELPMYGTPIGDIEGDGTIEMAPFSVEYTGNREAISGQLAGDGEHFVFSLPLHLNMGGGVEGVGIETEIGTMHPVEE